MSTEMTLAKIENNNNDNDDNNNNAVICKKPPSISKKGGRAINILKVALYMLRKKGNNKPSKSMVTNTALKRLMGSVRPLNYIQDGVGGMSPPHSPSPPPPPPPTDIPLILPPQFSPSSPDCGFVAGNATVSSPDNNDNNVAPTVIEVTTSPIHHVHSSSSFSCSSASSEGMSRYESALSLYDLDSHDDDDDDDEENDEDAYYDGLQGDDMIDAKAEMFIAKFYQQMKIQG